MLPHCPAPGCRGMEAAEAEPVFHLSRIKFPPPAPLSEGSRTPLPFQHMALPAWPRGQDPPAAATRQEQLPAPAAMKPPQNNNENAAGAGAGKAKSPQLIFIRVGFAICCRPSRPRNQVSRESC